MTTTAQMNTPAYFKTLVLGSLLEKQIDAEAKHFPDRFFYLAGPKQSQPEA